MDEVHTMALSNLGLHVVFPKLRRGKVIKKHFLTDITARMYHREVNLKMTNNGIHIWKWFDLCHILKGEDRHGIEA